MDVIDRPMAQEKCFVAASKIVSPGAWARSNQISTKTTSEETPITTQTTTF
jgi:hypothetical protein